MEQQRWTFFVPGGSISCGNITAAGEFNIYCVPEAAYVVFNAGWPVTMVGLDVTEGNSQSTTLRWSSLNGTQATGKIPLLHSRVFKSGCIQETAS